MSFFFRATSENFLNLRWPISQNEIFSKIRKFENRKSNLRNNSVLNKRLKRGGEYAGKDRALLKKLILAFLIGSLI